MTDSGSVGWGFESLRGRYRYIMLTKNAWYKLIPYFPAFLFFLNIGLKLLYLTTAPIGHDEPFSIYHAQFSLDKMFEQLANYNNPPLFEMILHVWIKLFGISPFSVRILPALFACLCPVILYLFAKRNFSLLVGVSSSLLLTFSDLLLYYAHDCRVYSLFVVLTLASFYYYFEIINPNRITIVKQILFVLFSTLLIYAHYFGIIVLGLQGLHLILFYRKQFLKIITHYLIICTLFLPCIFIVLTRFKATTKGNWIEPPSGLESLYNMIWTFSNVPVITVVCIAILFFTFIKVIVNKSILKWKENNKEILILIWFLTPFVGMFFISYWVPMYISRYLIFAVPAYYILLVLCVESLFKKVMYRYALLSVLIIGFACTNKLNPDKKQPIFETMRLIKQNKNKNTLVVFGTDEILPTVAYHYNQRYFSATEDGKEYHLTDSLLRADNVYCTYNSGDIKPILNGKFNKVIYIGLNEKMNAADYPIVTELNVNCNIEKQNKLGDGRWKISFYSLKNSK